MYSSGYRAERLTVFHMECAYTHRHTARSCVRVGSKPGALREDEASCASRVVAIARPEDSFCLGKRKKSVKTEETYSKISRRLCRCICARGRNPTVRATDFLRASSPRMVKRISAPCVPTCSSICSGNEIFKRDLLSRQNHGARPFSRKMWERERNRTSFEVAKTRLECI